MKTYRAGELREDMLVVPAHTLEGFALVPFDPTREMWAASGDAIAALAAKDSRIAEFEQNIRALIVKEEGWQ